MGLEGVPQLSADPAAQPPREPYTRGDKEEALATVNPQNEQEKPEQSPCGGCSS